MNKSVSDEKIIAALLCTDTVKAAAEQVGMKADTLRTRMKSPEFKVKYQEAKDQLIKSTVTSLQNKMNTAISVISEVMENTDNSPQIRVNAAEIILRYALKLTDTVEIIERLESLESIYERNETK